MTLTLQEQLDWIEIRGARENNLKNVSVKFPRNRLTVVTGVSGSGKSTLVFDVLCQESQRLYWKAMGRVADGLQRPNYDEMHHLSPIIAVTQTNNNRNPRSTVGTFSEIYTYLRLLYTAIGRRNCSICGNEFSFAELRTAPVRIDDEENGSHVMYGCPHCNHPIANITMAHFSFNTMHGACTTCVGLGETVEPIVPSVLDLSLSIRQGGVRTWKKGFWRHYGPLLVKASQLYRLPFEERDLDTPIGELHPTVIDLLLYGTDDARVRCYNPEAPVPTNMHEGRYEGIVPGLMRRYYEKAEEEGIRNEFSQFLRNTTCPSCQGLRLKKSMLEVTVNQSPIHVVSCKSIEKFKDWVVQLEFALPPAEREVVEPICKDLMERSDCLLKVGLGYLDLSRPFTTLSGGEAQRMRLASILKSGLVGMVYVFDEPTAGLHPRDTSQLVKALIRLKEAGNTVIVVEHDLDMIRSADYIIDIGPNAGDEGGHLVVAGTLEEVKANTNSLTGKYLRLEDKQREERRLRRAGNGKQLLVRQANIRNLKNIDVKFPLGTLIAVTGVSGSGKSSLIFDLLVQYITGKNELSEKHGYVEGTEHISKLILVDQQAMGKISRSNAATYTGAFDLIRNTFAKQAQEQGYNFNSSNFSFNVEGGRCEACQGTGTIKVQMHFMPANSIKCPSCRGQRFSQDILNVRYNGKNIYDVLSMSIKQAQELFRDEKKIRKILDCLCDVGLGYLKLGQPASTLSGGEAQRVKLATELSASAKGHFLYVLDEPSVGLHPSDVTKLANVLQGLVKKGHTVIVIEHNTSLIVEADWMVELGPEGGDKGGYLLATGTPDEIRDNPASITGAYI